MKIQMPEKVAHIIHTIQEAGDEAYAVGGCVRDSILGRTPDDWDITTSARPQEVKALFGRTVDTGLQHGTVTVLMGREGFEVTTYRIDGTYEDGRHPSQVTFTASLREDLRRRDFTINAMAYSEETGLVDIFGGMEDSRAGVIRCVGDAGERFGEDALRIMRAVRFSAQLGYRIDEGTKSAIRRLAPSLRRISAERIRTELVKLLTSAHPDELRTAWELGVTEVILPEFDRTMDCQQRNPHHCYTVGEHILHSLLQTAPDRVLRMTMLLHDIGKPQTMTEDADGVRHFHGHARVSEEMAGQILRRLKFDNDTIDKVCRLVRYHDYGNGCMPDGRSVRRAVNRVGEDIFPMLLAVKRADLEAQSDYQRQEKREILEAWERGYQEVMERRDCVSLKNLAVTGRDLIDAGMQPGKQMGKTLEEMLEIVLENPACNTREYLLSWLKDRGGAAH